ncbi:hypothetical protein, partial [Klebsiella pneumoniae]|uniref:hypothetical protein n=1 Tax=Klebsiella pneumoniae TaxID=573 RepID=UPI001D0EEF6E
DDAITEVNEHGKVIFNPLKVYHLVGIKNSSFSTDERKDSLVTQKSTPLNIKITLIYSLLIAI